MRLRLLRRTNLEKKHESARRRHDHIRGRRSRIIPLAIRYVRSLPPMVARTYCLYPLYTEHWLTQSWVFDYEVLSDLVDP